MKIYKVEYWDKERSKPSYIIEFSKSGRTDGVGIWFWIDGIKCWHWKFKNNLLNGLDKEWLNNSTNWHFQNLKKQNAQGIEIYFHRI